MRRLPSPWITIPVVLATVGGGIVGGAVTAVSCRPDGCVALTAVAAVLSALASFIGVGVVVVLAVRSIAEWRADVTPREQPAEEPGPPTC